MTLTQLFTAIANAIRAKKGTSGTIVASNFPTEIASITTGHLDNTEYEEANDDLDDILEGSTPITIYPPDWSELGYSNTPQGILNDFNYAKEIYDNWDNTQTNLSSKFASDTTLKYMPLVDTSNATNTMSMFNGCSNLINLPLINISNVTNTAQMFASCSSLESIPQLNMQNVTMTNIMFFSCSKLRTIPVLNFSKVTNMTNIFTSCPSLSNDSLNNILQTLAGATLYTGTKTLRNIGLSSSQATTCTGLSNWSALQNAGWTTGY